jgi:uncharacterized membrane protein
VTTAETESESRAQTWVRPARERLGRLRGRRHLWGVGGIALLTALLQGALGVQQYRDFYLGAYDLGIFDQAIRNYAHGNMPVSPLKDVHDAAQVIPGYGHVFSILGDHFSPILAVLAPLFWIWNNPVVLLVAQAVLFGAAVPSIWVFTRRAMRRLAPERTAVTAAYLVALAYGISWPLQMASQAGFHEVAFFTLLSAVAIERLQAGRLRAAALAALALLLVKEDAGYVVAAFGLVVLLRRQVDGVALEPGARRRYRWTGCGLFAAGVGVALAVQEWWLPAFGGRPGYYWYYGQLGSNLGSALWKIVSHPVFAFDVATQPGMKVHTFFLLLWPVLFCCLLSPYSLLAVPLLAERAFSDKSEHWGLDQHYNAFLAAILIMAAVDGAARGYRLAARARARWFAEARRPRRGLGPAYVRVWAGAVLLATLVAGVQWPMPLRNVFATGPWQSTPYIAAENQAVAMVPDGACVEADNNLATHLVSRTQVLLLDQVPRGCPWVVLQTATVSYPFSGPGAEAARARELAADGYQLVFSSNEVFVYHRP